MHFEERYRNFSFQKRRKASDLKRKFHRAVWHYYVSFYPPDSLKLMTGTSSAVKFQQREVFCSLPLINKVHSGNADRLWSKQHPQVLLWYTACLLKHNSSNSLLYLIGIYSISNLGSSTPKNVSLRSFTLPLFCYLLRRKAFRRPSFGLHLEQGP